MRDIKHMSDIPHGIIVIKGFIISILLSLFVQLFFFVKVSLYSTVILVFKWYMLTISDKRMTFITS